jgi:hypothetical protein
MVIYPKEGILISRIPGEDLNNLMERSSGPAISIFLSTQRISFRSRKDQIKLKNFLNKADKDLSILGHRPAEIAKLLKPAWDLQQNNLFWNNQGKGLAIYLAPDVFYYYCLPFSIPESISVSQRFHLKPILPLLSDNCFYLLALSQKKARLFRGSSYHLEEIDSIGLPQGIDSDKDEESSQRLSFHNIGQGGKQTFHGHGELNDDLKKKLSHYFQKINQKLNDFLAGDTSPLILAGVEYFSSIYRKVNTHPRLLEKMISGNPDKVNLKNLHSEAQKIIMPYFEQEKNRDLENYHKLKGTGQTANDLEQVLLSTKQGKVKVLFVSADQQKWGRFKPDSDELLIQEDDPQNGDIDLLDWATCLVFQRGQKVYLLKSSEMPDNSNISAILHY